MPGGAEIATRRVGKPGEGGAFVRRCDGRM